MFLLLFSIQNLLIGIYHAKAAPARAVRLAMIATPGRLRPQLSLPDALHGVGQSLDQIRWLIPFHVHMDHIGGYEDLPRIPILITAADLDFATDLQALRTGAVIPQQSAMLRDGRSQVFRFDDAGYELYKESLDLYGNGSIVLVPFSGHTPASIWSIHIKTKNFHWHVSGPHFRDYHLLLDEQAEQIFAMTDGIAERVRKLGGSTIRSVGHIARLKHVADNDAEYVGPLDMLGELREDNQALVARMIQIHDLCDETNDVATASLLENWIDLTQRRVWFLFETGRTGT